MITAGNRQTKNIRFAKNNIFLIVWRIPTLLTARSRFFFMARRKSVLRGADCSFS
jgi:hypothetical protein